LHWTFLLNDKESPIIDFGNELEKLIGTAI
jgi:hypothetical protein